MQEPADVTKAQWDLVARRLAAGVRVAVLPSAAARWVPPRGSAVEGLGEVALVASHPGDLAEALRWARTTGLRTEQARLALGQLLGIPVCCLRAHPESDLLQPFEPGQESAGAAWFVPCRPDCPEAAKVLGSVAGGVTWPAGVAPLPSGWTPTQVRLERGLLRLQAAGPAGSAGLTLQAAGPGVRGYQQAAGLCISYTGGKLTGPQEALMQGWWPELVGSAEAALSALKEPTPTLPTAEPKRLRPTRATAFAPRRHVLGTADVEQMFHVDYAWGDDGDPRQISRIGVIYRCNQWCAFCSLAEMDVELSVDKVQAAIRTARASGSTRLILTGGEPTLRPDLPELVAFARDVGFAHITLQTNAIRLSTGPLLERLVAAGMTHAQVSLHGPDAAFSDLLTQAPGTHDRSVAGVTRLLEAGVEVLLNCVLFAQTLDRLDAYLDLCTDLWQPHQTLLTLQFRMPSQEFDDVAVARQYMPRYSDLGPKVRAIIGKAQDRGFAVGEASQPVTTPSWCILQASGTDVSGWLQNPPPSSHHAWESSWFTRVPACQSCAASTHCPGARKDYVELWGDAEFAAIAAP